MHILFTNRISCGLFCRKYCKIQWTLFELKLYRLDLALHTFDTTQFWQFLSLCDIENAFYSFQFSRITRKCTQKPSTTHNLNISKLFKIFLSTYFSIRKHHWDFPNSCNTANYSAISLCTQVRTRPKHWLFYTRLSVQITFEERKIGGFSPLPFFVIEQLNNYFAIKHKEFGGCCCLKKIWICAIHHWTWKETEKRR